MLKNYIKISLRNLWKYKGYSLINLVGLATGMASFILILLWVQDELSYDRYHQKVDRIYRIVTLDPDAPSEGIPRTGAPWGPALKLDFPEINNFVRFREHGRTLMSVGDKRFYESEGLYADSTIFDVFSFPFREGSAETALTKPNTIVITQKMAEKYFGGERALGHSILFNNGAEFEITGVVENIPANSHFKCDYLIPFQMYNNWDLSEWNVRNFYTYILLSPEASPAEVEAKIPGFLQRRAAQESTSSPIISLQSIKDIHLHSHLFRELDVNGDIVNVYMFSAVAIFILLIACINFMNLATARATMRSKEVGIRKLVGSKRGQLISQFLGESVLMSLFAILLAIVLAELLLPGFNYLSGKQLNIEYSNNLFLMSALFVTVIIVGVISGMYPAFLLSSFKPITAIQREHKKSGLSLRKGLVIFQFAISISLIAGTTIIHRQLNYISEKKLGFEHEQVLVIRMDNSTVKPKRDLFRNELLMNPGIRAVSATSNLLGGGDWGMPFSYEGAEDGDRFSARVLVVDPYFLETLEMEMVAGRNFSREYQTDVSGYLLNESAVKELGWENPIGKMFGRPVTRNEQGGWDYENGRVIGVVKDFHFRSLHDEIEPMVIFMMPEWFSYLCVRLQPQRISETMGFIETKWRQFDPDRPFDYFFLDTIFDDLYRSEVRFGEIFMSFSALAILIACLGLFGLASFMAERRTKEIGIRKVLGATTGNIILNLSRDFTKSVLFANLLAWPVAFYIMNKWLQNFAFRIGLGWEVFLFSGAVALFIALFTVSVQSIRAALSNPVEALRYE